VHRSPDAELIALARRGSVEAAGVLFDRYWPSAWTAAYAVTADRAASDDAAQEAIQQAFAALDRFDATRPFGPWLKRIAVNRAIDHLRRTRRVAVLDEEGELHAWALGEAAEEDMRLWAVADAVAGLGTAKRAVVVLHYWLDFTIEEIAGTLGLPVGTVASRLSRALAELRVALGEDELVR
jgi:RNA polymerase sigma-70 factor (ECF subfamily)